jgi:predicted dehydrogenase
MATASRTASRIGIIGAGGVATRHAASLAGFDDADVVAVADPVAERAEALAALAAATPYPSYQAMLERERLDAVYVCVPPFAHGDPEAAVLDAGLPLFVEKPVAIDLPTAEAIAARVEAAGVPTATGYHWRALDTFERAAELLAERPAWLVHASYLDLLPPPAWWSRRELSGGQTVEQATHVVDVLRALVGEAVWVSGVAGRAAPATGEADVDQVAAAALRFATGAVGTLTSTSLLTWTDTVGVRFVSEGRTVDLTETDLTVRTGERIEHRPAAVDAKTRTDREFIDAVRGGPDRIRVPYAEALRTHRLACAISGSASTGTPVELI